MPPRNDPAAEAPASDAAPADDATADAATNDAPDTTDTDAKPDDVPPGFVTMHREDTSGCSFDGVAYEPDELGIVTVPAAAVEVLTSHGFALV